MKLSIQLLLLSIVLLMAGCAPATVAPSATPESEATATPAPAQNPDIETGNPLADTNWQLAFLGTAATETPVIKGSALTLQFGADGQIGGSGGCNTFGGEYQIDGNTITFGTLISTLRACADNALTAQEQSFLQALQAATQFELVDDQLTLTATPEDVVLTFGPALAGTLPSGDTAGPTSPLNTPADTAAIEWTRQQFGSSWDIAYPVGWTVNDAGANEGAIQVEGSYGEHNYAVVFSYPIGMAAPSLPAWVDEQLVPLTPEERAVIELTEFSAAEAMAHKVLNLPNPDGTGLTHRVYIWRTQGKTPRLITINQVDDLPFDGAAMSALLDQFSAGVLP